LEVFHHIGGIVALKGEAFVPGHITGFFEIHLDDSDPLKCGSRGAGFCVAKGARTTVRIEDAKEQAVSISIDGAPAPPASTSRRVVDLMLDDQPYDVDIETKLELPVAQGMGISGAGALGAAIAIDSALGLSSGRDALVAIAHRAEVESRTGLGDVIAQSKGGLEMRTAPGAPPHGQINVQTWESELLLVIFNPPLTTKQILTDPERKAAINHIGSGMLDVFGADQTPGRFLKLSREFTMRSGLASKSLMDALRHIPLEYTAAMVMLGNTMFVFGNDLHKIATEFEDSGRCILTKIDNQGAF
jgi:pantoate kinase